MTYFYQKLLNFGLGILNFDGYYLSEVFSIPYNLKAPYEDDYEGTRGLIDYNDELKAIIGIRR